MVMDQEAPPSHYQTPYAAIQERKKRRDDLIVLLEMQEQDPKSTHIPGYATGESVRTRTFRPNYDEQINQRMMGSTVAAGSQQI